MQTIEFQTTVMNGMIEIPPEHRGELPDHVKVTLQAIDAPVGGENLIDELIARPLKLPGFHPLTREEAHAR